MRASGFETSRRVQGGLLSEYVGEANAAVQGNWAGTFGQDGYVLCAFQDESSSGDLQSLPAYVNSSTPFTLTSVTRSKGAPLAAEGGISRGVQIVNSANVEFHQTAGHWRFSALVPGAQWCRDGHRGTPLHTDPCKRALMLQARCPAKLLLRNTDW